MCERERARRRRVCIIRTCEACATNHPTDLSCAACIDEHEDHPRKLVRNSCHLCYTYVCVCVCVCVCDSCSNGMRTRGISRTGVALSGCNTTGEHSHNICTSNMEEATYVIDMSSLSCHLSISQHSRSDSSDRLTRAWCCCDCVAVLLCCCLGVCVLLSCCVLCQRLVSSWSLSVSNTPCIPSSLMLLLLLVAAMSHMWTRVCCRCPVHVHA